MNEAQVATVPVRLTPVDIAWGIDLGKWRTLNGLSTPNRVPTKDGVAVDANGALAEVAVCRFDGSPLPMMSAKVDKSLPDIAPDIEVRWRSRDDWDLPIRNDDVARRRFVLVTGYVPTFRLHGWLWREDVRDEWRRDPGDYGRPAWFCPQAALRPMTTFERRKGAA